MAWIEENIGSENFIEYCRKVWKCKILFIFSFKYVYFKNVYLNNKIQVMKKSLDSVVSRAKRKWFVYPWSDIYWGLANSWDYWPYWTLLRKNIVDLILKRFVQKRQDMVYLDAALLMHPKVWESSGHVSGFNDPLIDDKKTWERFRADKLIEDFFENIREDKKYSDDDIKSEFKLRNLVPDSRDLEELYNFFIENNIKNPNTKKTAERTKVRKFSLMLSTQLWVIEDSWSKVWLRPETAQWVYVNFRNIVDTTRMKVPFGAIQIWKAFRNEITPWNFIFRTREFEQAEIQYFVEPWTSWKFFSHFEEEHWKFWLEDIGLNKENLRQRDHDKDEMAHYAAKARDFEYKFPWGWGELQWIHDRTDFDLKNHQEHSWSIMQYVDWNGKRYIPHVVETALWIWRAMITVMVDSYDEEEYIDSNWNQEQRTVIRFNKKVAPIKFTIMPLIRKSKEMLEISNEIFDDLSNRYMCEYDERWAIWKRYRRQDEIWTPYCVTVDHQSIEDWTVTVRDRDSMEQIRVPKDQIYRVYEEWFNNFK